MNKPTLLPHNATTLELGLEQATSRLADVPLPVRQLWNPDTCPVELLPWLAWAFSVDRWNPEWSEQQKRQLVRNSVFIHKHKGTLGAVRRALESLGYSAAVVEWFDEETPAQPYTFKIDVTLQNEGVSDFLYDSIEQIIRDTKNVRSHLAGILVSGRVEGVAAFAGAAISGTETEVYPYQETLIEQGSDWHFLSAEYCADTVTIFI